MDLRDRIGGSSDRPRCDASRGRGAPERAKDLRLSVLGTAGLAAGLSASSHFEEVFGVGELVKME